MKRTYTRFAARHGCDGCTQRTRVNEGHRSGGVSKMPLQRCLHAPETDLARRAPKSDDVGSPAASTEGIAQLQGALSCCCPHSTMTFGSRGWPRTARSSAALLAAACSAV